MDFTNQKTLNDACDSLGIQVKGEEDPAKLKDIQPLQVEIKELFDESKLKKYLHPENHFQFPESFIVDRSKLKAYIDPLDGT